MSHAVADTAGEVHWTTQLRSRIGSAAPSATRTRSRSARCSGSPRRSTRTRRAFKRGSALPESWYAILFGTLARQSDLGPDGHPTTGDFMPPMHGTRRMFAGRRTTFHRTLKVGDTVTRLSTVSRAEPKSGRTGAFTLVTVTHEMSGPVRPRHHRGAGPRLPRRRRGRHHRGTEGSAARRGQAGVVARDRARYGAAVPLFRAHLQRPSHPLRPALHA